MTIISSRFPGFDTARVVDDLTIRGHYLVFEVRAEDILYFIHNIYAPCDSAAKSQFYSTITQCQYPPGARHIVAGDLNLAMDLAVDSSSGERRDSGCRATFLQWATALDVVDAWRLHHPVDKVFSGPVPRRNRLDFIFLDDRLMTDHFSSADYFSHHHGGDHLLHRVLLSTLMRKGPGYWSLPSSLLDYPDVVDAIANEATQLLSVLRRSPNPGLVWDAWKRNTRSSLRQVEAHLRRQPTQEIRKAQTSLDFADDEHRTRQTADSARRLADARAVFRFQRSQLSQFQQDHGFDVHAHEMEASSRRFFRCPLTSGRRAPIASVHLPDGSVSSDPSVITNQFRQYWGAMLGDPGCGAPLADIDSTAQAQLLESITTQLPPSQATALDAPITAVELVTTIHHRHLLLDLMDFLVFSTKLPLIYILGPSSRLSLSINDNAESCCRPSENMLSLSSTSLVCAQIPVITARYLLCKWM